MIAQGVDTPARRLGGVRENLGSLRREAPMSPHRGHTREKIKTVRREMDRLESCGESGALKANVPVQPTNVLA